jgi:hypothetical protein
VPDRDAFGNEITPSDPTAAFGAEPAPPVAAPAAQPTRRSAAPRRAPAAPRSSRGGAAQAFRRVTTGFVAVAVVAVVLGAAGLGLVAGGDGDSAPSTEVPSAVPLPAMPEAPGARATPARTGSLLRRPAFTEALTQLRRADLGRLNSLRITRDRIDAVFLAGDERVRYVSLLAGERPEVVRTGSSRLVIEAPLPLAAIDPGVPERLARAVARRTRRPVSSIDYLTLSKVAGEPTWFAYGKNGRAYFADARGRIQGRAL